jgi:hypothetical protein
MDKSKPLFSASDIQKTLIIDDQYLAIREPDHLIISKKFLKFAIQSQADELKKRHWQNF